ncbi:MAG: hypothetical protein K8R18_08135 [Parvibaculum sp.]|uniref:Acg family FMN-binding oxidoreductase n=1 Tax=Parvibaculum sp. TaxID=2024848 RepID=UPI0025DD8B6A|nr:hypothetical protein [Parvibaculum sp.]MCE9649575.1 hypothetical protein [Parvibaculum sp.]
MKKPDLTLTRRNLLGAGSAVTLIFAAGVLWRAKERGVLGPAPSDAYTPWDLWNATETKGTPLALVAAGILSSSPHNTQPWIFHVSADRIELYADTSRNLGAFDPYLREMHIGLGCAVETMVHAAGPNGYRVAVEAPTGNLLTLTDRKTPVLAAALALSPLSSPAEEDSLYQAIPMRHTNRHPYDRARGLPPSAKAIMADVAEEEGIQLYLFEDGQARTQFDEAVVAATEEIITDHEMVEASSAWMRESSADVLKYRDGLNFDTAGLAPWLTLAAKLLPSLPAEEGHKAWLDQTRNSQLPSAPLTGFIAVRDRYDRAQSLAVGRVWARMQLTATALGFSMQPVNQPIETVDRERQLGKESKSEARLTEITGDAAWQPTFAFRAGFPTTTCAISPRRPLKSVVA